MSLADMDTGDTVYTSTTDFSCKVLAGTECRCFDGTAVTTSPGSRDGKWCARQKECVARVADKCVCYAGSKTANPVLGSGAKTGAGTSDSDQVCTDKSKCVAAGTCYNSTNAKAEPYGTTQVRTGADATSAHAVCTTIGS